MKRWGCIIPLVIIAALLLLFALGPRVQIDTTLDPVTLPADLDAYLAESEAQFDDIVPGTEKIIIWANPNTKAKTDVALVYLHGFSATRQEAAPLSDLVAEELDANLYYTRLSGHGRDGEAMTEATGNHADHGNRRGQRRRQPDHRRQGGAGCCFQRRAAGFVVRGQRTRQG